jgi:glycosyltransferase involved in cell wall biosynthesis
VGGSPELVDDGRTGLLFAPGDPHALATAILRLSDPALRLQLARAAREYVEHHHGQSALAAATASVYEHCLRTATGRNNRTADTHGQAAAAAGMTREGP